MGLALRRGAVCYRELPRIPLPRTPVNRGKMKGHSPVGLDPSRTLPTLVGEACSYPLALLELRRQSFDKALRDRVEESIRGSGADEHLLAVGADHIRSVGEHPVQARAATHYVLACRLVGDVKHIVAVSCGEDVFDSGRLEFAIHHEVVTFPT